MRNETELSQKNARNGLTHIALFSALILSGVTASATELLNSSYDVSRELFTALNPGFQAQWEQQNPGDKLTIKQSHAGSSKQALAILQGLKADVVTYNQITDVQILHDRGNLIPADWQARLPNNSSPFYSTMAFLVRKGNPKNIRNWDDLVREDVKLVFLILKPPVMAAIPIWLLGERPNWPMAAMRRKPATG